MGDSPTPWDFQNPEALVLSRETLRAIEASLAELPEAQLQVVLLRDVEGLGPNEVCNILGVSDTYQRVLLHRGRARVRRALDIYIREGGLAASGARAGRNDSR